MSSISPNTAGWRPVLGYASEPNPKKRVRTDGDGADVRIPDDESEDNISLVSRSPSPQPAIDISDISKYDEYLDKPAHETVTVETKIKSSNKGFAMLARFGWREGQPLGLSGGGRVDPIPFTLKRDLTGVGKTSYDMQIIEETVAQRRGLDSERQRKETDEQRKERETNVAQRTALQEEITGTLRAFYCALCDKQFQNVAQYDEHTNSYAHAHKARYKDMQTSSKAFQSDHDKRKEKEKKREEKELRKLAKAAGVKISRLTVPPVPVPSPVSVQTGEMASKNSGWIAVASSQSSSFLDLSTSSTSSARRDASVSHAHDAMVTSGSGGWMRSDATHQTLSTPAGSVAATHGNWRIASNPEGSVQSSPPAKGGRPPHAIPQIRPH